MRHGARQRHVEEEEESVFISMTDMTVSFLFIVMILLAFFATQIAPGETVPKEQLDERDSQIATLLEELQIYRSDDSASIPQLMSENSRLEGEIQDLAMRLAAIRAELELAEGADAISKIAQLRAELQKLHDLLADSTGENVIERYNTLVAIQRAELLQALQSRIAAADPSIVVGISGAQDALQFMGDGLFASRSATPSRQGSEKMRIIAGILQDVVGCYSFGEQSRLDETCNEHVAIIDAIQIEGHADSDGLDVTNMDLSARRGAAIYGEMLSANPDLLAFVNLLGQPLLSVAGYGEGRPIADEEVLGGKDANRRIDIRFIMFSPPDEETVPSSLDDLMSIRELLATGESR
jgi:flagellar motor protein MotB